MNSIDLIDKLKLPSLIGLEGEEALMSQKTIMDAYLSAASYETFMNTNSSENGAGLHKKTENSANQLVYLVASPLVPENSGNIDLFQK